MKKILNFLLFIVVLNLFSSLSWAANDPVPTECANASGKLVVTISEELSNFPIRYTYYVTNLTDKSLYKIVIGESDVLTLKHIPPSLQSLQVGSSSVGWEPMIVRGVEYRFTRIIWRATDSSTELKPNDSLGGFSIIVGEPAQNIQTLIGTDGSTTEPYEISSQPVSAYFGQGNCMWSIPEQ